MGRAVRCWPGRIGCLLLLVLLGGMARTEPINDPALLDLLGQAPTAADYPNDDAVWLRRDMEITLEPSGATIVRDHRWVKLLTPQARTLGQWDILYDRANETLEVPVARTLLNGRAFPVVPTQISESAVYSGIAWYDALTVRRYPLPATVVGAVLETETVIRRATPRLVGDLGTRLHLQQSYPVREACYTLRVPAAQHLTIRFSGLTAPVVTERIDGAYRRYAWTVHDLPALRITEAQAPPAADVAISARVASLTGWAPVAAWYARITADRDALTDDLRAVAVEHTRDCATRDAKIAALHQVVRELPYVAVELGDLSDVPHPADAVWRQRCGDCKDKATLLRALLRAVGIPSDYVLVRTTDRGSLDRTLYSPSEFNHVILAVPTPAGDRFLDASLADAPADLLPPTVEGAEGLIIRGDGELVTLPTSPAEGNRTEIAVRITVAAAGSAVGRATLTFTGQNALSQRTLLAQVPPDRYREALEGTLAPRLGVEIAITGVEVHGLHAAEHPLVVTTTFTSPAYLQNAGGQWSGYLPTFMYQANRYRTVTTRALPFQQFLASSLHCTADIALPAGCAVVHVPDPVRQTSVIGTYEDAVTVAGDVLHYTCTLATQRGRFPATALPAVHAWASLLALEGRNQLQFFLRRP